MEKYEKWLKYQAKLFSYSAWKHGIALDDLYQEARLALWNCLKYKQENSSGFISFLRISVRNALVKYIIKETMHISHTQYYKQRKTNSQTQANLSLLNVDSLEIAQHTFEEPEDNMEVVSFLEYCEKKNPAYAAIIKSRMEGDSNTEVAEKANVSLRDMSRKLVDIRDLYVEYYNVEEPTKTHTQVMTNATKKRKRNNGKHGARIRGK